MSYRDRCRSVVNLILDTHSDTSLSPSTKRMYITSALDNLTSRINVLDCGSSSQTVVKRDGSLYWSQKALDLRDYYGGDVTLDKGNVRKRKGVEAHEDSFYVEHPVPKSVLREYIRENLDEDLEDLTDKVFFSMRTVILTKKENSLISSKLNSKMPSGWKFGDNLFARYEGLPFCDSIVENPLKLKMR